MANNQIDLLAKYGDEAIAESIASLYLVKKSATGFLKEAIARFLVDPKAILDMRRQGQQVDLETRTKLGISKRGFLSIEMLEHLTEKGLQEPLFAHERVLLRSSFTLSRWQHLEHAKASPFQCKVKRICPEANACPGEDWEIVEAHRGFPPTTCQDSVHKTCRSVFSSRRAERI